jgi:two-component sensor histidine kinase
MQVISSILSLQSSYLKDEKLLSILRESQNRIKSMAFIHERLYRTKDFSKLKFSDYVENLAKSLISTYELGNLKIEMDFDLDEVFLNLDSAIPCGLILNELISNSLKYAFKGRQSGNITVSLKEKKDKLVALSVADNGVGIDQSINIAKTETLGLQLVHTLIEQLEGEINLSRDNGSRFDIIFSKST